MTALNESKNFVFVDADSLQKARDQAMSVTENASTARITKTEPVAIIQSGDISLPAETVNDPHLQTPQIELMSVEELLDFATDRLNKSKARIELIKFETKKCAVDVYWAGGALTHLKEKYKKEQRGKWYKFLSKNDLAFSTVSEAIKIYRVIKDVALLNDLGVTQAKELVARLEEENPNQDQNQKQTRKQNQKKENRKKPKADTTRNEIETTASNIRLANGQVDQQNNRSEAQESVAIECLEELEDPEVESSKTLLELLEEEHERAKTMLEKVSIICDNINGCNTLYESEKYTLTQLKEKVSEILDVLTDIPVPD